MATSTIKSIKQQVGTWTSLRSSLVFPSGATDTQYTYCYKNKSTDEVFLNMYLTFPNGLSAGSDLIGNLPPSNYASINLVYVAYYGGEIAYGACYIDTGGAKLKTRTAIPNGRTVMATLMYLS